MLQNVGNPEPNHRKAGRPHEFIATPVGIVLDVLTAIDFDDQTFRATGEISEVRPQRKLANKFVATQFAIVEFIPEQRFADIATMTKSSRK